MRHYCGFHEHLKVNSERENMYKGKRKPDLVLVSDSQSAAATAPVLTLSVPKVDGAKSMSSPSSVTE